MSEKHTLSVLVENKPGVLTRVSALFTRRGFNIHSLAVGPTEHEDVSPTSVVIETVGSESKVKALLGALQPYGVKEIVQSGAVAITRGPRSMTDQLKEK